jgi:hypothetical protein
MTPDHHVTQPRHAALHACNAMLSCSMSFPLQPLQLLRLPLRCRCGGGRRCSDGLIVFFLKLLQLLLLLLHDIVQFQLKLR